MWRTITIASCAAVALARGEDWSKSIHFTDEGLEFAVVKGEGQKEMPHASSGEIDWKPVTAAPAGCEGGKCSWALVGDQVIYRKANDQQLERRKKAAQPAAAPTDPYSFAAYGLTSVQGLQGAAAETYANGHQTYANGVNTVMPWAAGYTNTRAQVHGAVGKGVATVAQMSLEPAKFGLNAASSVLKMVFAPIMPKSLERTTKTHSKKVFWGTWAEIAPAATKSLELSAESLERSDNQPNTATTPFFMDATAIYTMGNTWVDGANAAYNGIEDSVSTGADMFGPVVGTAHRFGSNYRKGVAGVTAGVANTGINYGKAAVGGVQAAFTGGPVAGAMHAAQGYGAAFTGGAQAVAGSVAGVFTGNVDAVQKWLPIGAAQAK